MREGRRINNVMYSLHKATLPISSLLKINEDTRGKQYASEALFDGVGLPLIGGGIRILPDGIKTLGKYLPENISHAANNFASNISPTADTVGSLVLMYGFMVLVSSLALSIIYRNE